MSQMPPAGGPGGAGQPSEEELRQMASQMRGAPVTAFVQQVQQALLEGMQFKLGRNDARLLLDLCSMVNDHTRGLVQKELTQQVDQALQELRLAQVEAEQQVIEAAKEGHSEANDLPRRPPAPGEERPAAATQDEAADGDATGGQGPQEPPAGGDAASRLWVPGR